MWRSRGARLAAGACLVIACVAWNARFDHGIRAGTAEYFARHDAWLRGEASRPPMQAIMQAASARGVRDASLVAGAVLAAGLVPLAWSRRRVSEGSRTTT